MQNTYYESEELNAWLRTYATAFLLFLYHHFQAKLDNFQIHLYALLNKPNAFGSNCFQIETIFFHIKLETLKNG